jgi:nucleotide-binding universal stress UspA family protein
MPREIERAIEEAVAIAMRRGGTLAAVTLEAEDPTPLITLVARKVLQRHGAEDADVTVVPSDGPTRLVSVEIKRTKLS